MQINTSQALAQNVPAQRSAAVTAALRYVNNKFAARDWKYLEEELDKDAMSGAEEAEALVSMTLATRLPRSAATRPQGRLAAGLPLRSRNAHAHFHHS